MSYSLCELPDVRMCIASNIPILGQIFNILCNPGFEIKTTLLAVDMMVQVADINSSHCFLTRYSVIEILVGVPFCQFDPDDPDDSQYAFLSK